MEEKIDIKYIDTTNMEITGDSIDYSNKEYTIDDCVLVRTTDIFPIGGIVQTPINGKAYGFGKSTIIGELISDKLRLKYPKHSYDMEEAEKFSSELSEFEVCFETCRSTIHFALNGLVGSTAYGNFDNKPFVIIEPLKQHINNSLKSLRVEDVYFDNDMKLSNQATILISEQYFRANCNNLEFLNELKNFKVYVFKGNQQAAVGKVLSDLGYDSFLISSNGYSNGLSEGNAANNMWNFVHEFAKENNISLDRHFYSQINYEDTMLRQEKGLEIDKLHLNYLLDNSNVSAGLAEKIRNLIDEDPYLLNPLLEQLIEEIGLDQIKMLTKEFNNLYIRELNSTKSKTI